MASRAVLLGSVFLTGSSLLDQVRPGLGALSRVDRRLLAETERQKVGDSIDLDEATRDAHPNANRWDYLLSIPSASLIVGVEPHPARDSEIPVVIAKKTQAVDVLRDHLPPRHRVAKWFWVSRGSVRFSAMERAKRLLDQNGIAFKGRLLTSFD